MILAGRRIQPGTGHEAGRQLLEELYCRHTGQPMPPILVTDMGKPYFPDSPWHFSITHTKEHVFCALAQHPIGIDGEEQDRVINPALAKKILSPSEWEQYAAAQDPQRALLIFWVLKEALAKATGEGLRIYPNHTAFSLDDSRVVVRSGCILAVIELPQNIGNEEQ